MALDLTKALTLEHAVDWLWDTLGRDFADHVATYPVNEAKWRRAINRYFDRLYAQVGYVRVLGKMESQPLEGIYTDVNVLDKLSAEQRYSLDYMREHFGPRTDAAQKQVVRKDGMAVLREHDQLFILGKPGAGKTTFLKWAALQAVHRRLDYFPIFVTLKALSDKKPGLNSAEQILDYIAHTSEVRRIPSPKTFIEYALESGKALVLFDGLDEVNLEDNLRGNLVEALNEFVAEYGDGKTLITCRVAATEYSFTQFEYVEMADFTPQQMGTFIDNWFSHDKDKAKRCRAELVEKRDNEALQELAQIPLLMTLLCLTFEELNAFPVKRSQIYDEATRALLSKWDASRNIRRDTIYRGLDLQEKKWMLAAVAAHTFERGDYFVEEGEMAALLEDALRSIPNVENPNGRVVLKAIEAQHGILVERARGIHSFSHLTLQEYFTALNIVENARHKNYLPALMEHITDNRWREVFLLTAGMLRSAEDFFELYSRQLQSLLGEDKILNTLALQAARQATTNPIGKSPFTSRLFFTVLEFAHANASLFKDAFQLILEANSSVNPDYQERINAVARLEYISEAILKSLAFAKKLQFNTFKLTSYYIQEAINHAAILHVDSLYWHVQVEVNSEMDFSITRANESAKLTCTRILEAISYTNLFHDFHELREHLVGAYDSILTLLESNSWSEFQATVFANQIANLYENVLSKQQLEANSQFREAHYRNWLTYLKSAKLYIDCLQVANIKNRETWEERLLLPSFMRSSTALQTVDSNPTPESETGIEVNQHSQFLKEKQQIFYVELPMALRGAFVEDEFRMLLRTCCGGRYLDDYSRANGFRVMVVDVISGAEREGWLIDLVREAHATRPGNRLLKEVHDEMEAFLTEFEIDQL